MSFLVCIYQQLSICHMHWSSLNKSYNFVVLHDNMPTWKKMDFKIKSKQILKHQNWICFNACTTVVSQPYALEQSKQECSECEKQTAWMKKKCMRTWYQYRQTSHSIFVSPGFDWLSFFSFSLFTMLHKKYFLFLTSLKKLEKKIFTMGWNLL